MTEKKQDKKKDMPKPPHHSAQTLSIENRQHTFDEIFAWTQNAYCTIVAEDNQNREINLMGFDTEVKMVKQCSFVMHGYKYHLPLPETKHIFVGAQRIKGKGLVITVNQQPAIYLANNLSTLQAFPEDIEWLVLVRANDFDELTRFQNLKTLSIHKYYMEELAGLVIPDSVERIHLHECESLTNLKPLRRCPNLTHLQIILNNRIRTMTDISFLPNLQSLSLYGCKFVNLPKRFANPNQLKKLIILVSPNIKTIDLPEPLSGLKTLYIAFCHNLKTVNVQNASNLENLSFESCYKLHRVSLGQPVALKDVKIIGAPNLEKIEGIESAGNTVHVEIKR